MFNKIIIFFKKPKLFLLKLDNYGILRLSDKKYLELLYEKNFNKKLNLNNPKTFNEKLQWLKLNDRKDIYTTMVDKYEVKKYISNIIGSEYVIPNLGVYNNFDEINFDEMPNQFVIKCTHDSGGLVIVKDKEKFDKESAKKIINKSLKRNFYYFGREWPYKNVKPRIIIEKYMEDKNDKELRDYKFYCFNGKMKALLLTTNRQSKTEKLAFDYFDEKFNHLNLINYWHPNAKITPHKPINFEKMKELSEKISKGIPHVRVDFYEANGKIYFGELTFYAMSGFLKLYPNDWELEWGKLIDLSLVRKNEK